MGVERQDFSNLRSLRGKGLGRHRNGTLTPGRAARSWFDTLGPLALLRIFLHGLLGCCYS